MLLLRFFSNNILIGSTITIIIMMVLPQIVKAKTQDYDLLKNQAISNEDSPNEDYLADIPYTHKLNKRSPCRYSGGGYGGGGNGGTGDGGTGIGGIGDDGDYGDLTERRRRTNGRKQKSYMPKKDTNGKKSTIGRHKNSYLVNNEVQKEISTRRKRQTDMSDSKPNMGQDLKQKANELREKIRSIGENVKNKISERLQQVGNKKSVNT